MEARTQVYVNPRCSKCRTALALLADRGVEAEQVAYLDDPPTTQDLLRLMRQLGMTRAR